MSVAAVPVAAVVPVEAVADVAAPVPALALDTDRDSVGVVMAVTRDLVDRSVRGLRRLERRSRGTRAAAAAAAGELIVVMGRDELSLVGGEGMLRVYESWPWIVDLIESS